MMMAIRASTEARTPKMMVPVESAFDWVLAEVVVVLSAGYDLRVVLVLRADMVAMRMPMRLGFDSGLGCGEFNGQWWLM